MEVEPFSSLSHPLCLWGRSQRNLRSGWEPNTMMLWERWTVNLKVIYLSSELSVYVWLSIIMSLMSIINLSICGLIVNIYISNVLLPLSPARCASLVHSVHHWAEKVHRHARRLPESWSDSEDRVRLWGIREKLPAENQGSNDCFGTNTFKLMKKSTFETELLLVFYHGFRPWLAQMLQQSLTLEKAWTVFWCMVELTW